MTTMRRLDAVVVLPAIHTGAEHLSGAQYAEYLAFLAQGHTLPIATDCRVQDVIAQPDGGFVLHTSQGVPQTEFLIWATGEFQFPHLALLQRLLLRQGRMGLLSA